MTCNTRRKHVKKGRGTKRKIMRGGWSFADFMENMLGTKKEAEPPAAPAPPPPPEEESPAPAPAPSPSTGGRKKRTKNNRRRLKHKKSRHPKRRH